MNIIKQFIINFDVEKEKRFYVVVLVGLKKKEVFLVQIRSVLTQLPALQTHIWFQDSSIHFSKY